jgi:hypothetical protein
MKATYTVVAWRPSHTDPCSEVLVSLSRPYSSKREAETSSVFAKAERDGREPYVRSSKSSGATEVHGW